VSSSFLLLTTKYFEILLELAAEPDDDFDDDDDDDAADFGFLISLEDLNAFEVVEVAGLVGEKSFDEELLEELFEVDAAVVLLLLDVGERNREIWASFNFFSLISLKFS
jgi:hypothetical protein